MSFTVNLPAELESELRSSFGPNLDRAALEALAIEGYRSRRLSLAQVRRLLALETRIDAEAFLGAHGARWNYGPEDLDADRATLNRVLDRK